MARHDKKNAELFLQAMKEVERMDEQTLVDSLNPTIILVETDDTYNTKQKLNIFSLISSLSNSEERQRTKFVKKIYKALR